MIRFFRNYQKTVFGILIFFAAALLLSSFGIDLAHQRGNNSDRPAIQVGDASISRTEFVQKRRQVESQYRKMFGPQYQQLIEQFGLNIGQSVLDGLVDTTLLSQVAHQKGFAASDNDVLDAIQKQFPGGYSRDALAAAGVTPEQFLKETEQQVMLEQMATLLRQASSPTKQEIEQRFIKEQTQYNLEYISFLPKKFEATIAEPSEDELKSFYDSHNVEFQTKPTVSFSYVSFDPEKFYAQVEVPQEEIEFYYTENQKEFEIPQRVTARHIQILFPKDNDPKKLAAARERATEALGKAQAGENFQALVKQYSDDITTKATGGLLGVVPKGKFKGVFDQKVFALKEPGIAELIETETGFQIVAVEKIQEAETKQLEEVRSDIIKKLQSEQAPAIADAAAREFFDGFLATEMSLEAFATEKKFPITKQDKPLTTTDTVSGAPKDFTQRVMNNLPEIKQLIEDKKTSYIVEVTNSQEARIPELSSIRSAVLAAYKVSKSFEAAKRAADNALALSKESKSFADVAKGVTLSVEKASNIKRGGRAAPLTSEENEDIVLTDAALPTAPQQVLSGDDGSYYLARVIAKNIPQPSTATAQDLKKIEESLNQELAQNLRKEILDALKTKTKIVIDQSVLAAG